MIKIGFIPLDSRPCNTDWIKDLSALAGISCLTLPKRVLGNLHQPLDWNLVQSFLVENVSNVDIFILPIDAILHGGLIQSRKVELTLPEAKERLGIISRLKKLNPALKIYAYDTVLRTSISTFDEESKRNWQLVNEYSKYKGRYFLYNREEDLQHLKRLEETISPMVLDHYLTSRSVKHQVNLLCLDLVNNNTIDFLLLLQEDSMPDGIQTLEHVELQKYIDDHHLENKAYLHNGTDEGLSVLLTKCLADTLKRRVSYYLLTTNPTFLNQVQPFEDRPYICNLNAMTKILNMDQTEDVTKADFVLAIFVRDKNGTMEVADRSIPQRLQTDEYTEGFIAQTNAFIRQHFRVFLLDIAVPNGGIWALLQQIDFLHLFGYSAWNTASNSTGTLLAQAYLFLASGNSSDKIEKNKRILLRSILDDCLYQDIVRAKIHKYAADHHLNIFDFGNNPILDKILNDELHQMTQDFTSKDFIAYFPWNRAFEIGINFLE
jgi:hypothetical protein